MRDRAMTETHEAPDVSADEREQWEEPELVVTSLKEAMTQFGGTGSDGTFNYS